MVVKSSGVDVTMFALKYGRHISLSTWDGLNIPLPFSEVFVDATVFRCEKLESTTITELTLALETELKSLQSRLESVNF
ncbi:MAG: hypothetical protein LBB18_00775 [Puniceicoccales bacterium]|jgi:lysophospholipid acyltransferase (LPLAT)-like uncharacterized protein|nr:hypothetical protein [Puniceicoccales bacterium]